MDLNKYETKALHINCVGKVDIILAKLIEVENLVGGTSRFDFDKFELDVRLLIRKPKIQIYFIEKFRELRTLYPQQVIPLTPVEPSVQTNRLHLTTHNKPNAERRFTQVDNTNFISS